MAKLRVDKIASVGVSTETTGSVFFDGTGDYLSVADSDDFHYGSLDFTAECWVYPTASPNQPMLVGQWSGSTGGTTLSWVMMLSNDSNRYLRGLMSSDTSAVDFDLVSSASLELNQWSHCAFVKNGSTFTLYLNGINVASTTDSDTLSNATNALTIGATSTGAQPFQGYLSNVRVCKGHAVYTSNFAPPTRELEVHQGPDDDRTVLLCCYDGENIFADKSGRHIIAAYGDRLSSPTPTATDSPIGITTLSPGLTRDVDNTFGPVFQGGAGYASQNWLTLPKGTTTQRNRGRAVFGGGRTSPSVGASNIICFANIATTGNAQEFGDLTYEARGVGSCSSSTRGIFLGGADPALQTEIDFVTISTTGNAQVFSTLGTAKRNFEGLSNQTRGVFAAGQQPGSFPAALTSEMEFITIASAGSATDFGNLSRDTLFVLPAASSTRGIFAGGYDGPSPANGVNTMEFITIASTGNAVNFGDLFTGRYSGGGASSETRAVFAGGADGPLAGDMKDVIDYVTIASTGDAVDFGNLIAVNENIRGTSNKIRGLFAGGYGPGTTNVMQYITIASTGDAQDFGDLTSPLAQNGQCSDSHGGLG